KYIDILLGESQRNFTYLAGAKAEEVLHQALDSITAEDTDLKCQINRKLLEGSSCSRRKKRNLNNKITSLFDGKDEFNLGGPNNGEIAAMEVSNLFTNRFNYHI
ncbi:hypothetical protein G9A89_004709, partial [Geosiphon pyriformis]